MGEFLFGPFGYSVLSQISPKEQLSLKHCEVIFG